MSKLGCLGAMCAASLMSAPATAGYALRFQTEQSYRTSNFDFSIPQYDAGVYGELYSVTIEAITYLYTYERFMTVGTPGSVITTINTNLSIGSMIQIIGPTAVFKTILDESDYKVAGGSSSFYFNQSYEDQATLSFLSNAKTTSIGPNIFGSGGRSPFVVIPTPYMARDGKGDFGIITDLRFTYFTQFAGPTAVPEPMSWAMMVGGFGLVGGIMRQTRRRKTLYTLDVRYSIHRRPVYDLLVAAA